MQLFRNVNLKSLIVHLLWLAGLIIFYFTIVCSMLAFVKHFLAFCVVNSTDCPGSKHPSSLVKEMPILLYLCVTSN